MEADRKKSVLVKDRMTRKVLSLEPDLEISAATQMLIAYKISGAPVLDQHGRLVGIISRRNKCVRVKGLSG
mgnify:CR=1 FL=1